MSFFVGAGDRKGGGDVDGTLSVNTWLPVICVR